MDTDVQREETRLVDDMLGLGRSAGTIVVSGMYVCYLDYYSCFLTKRAKLAPLFLFESYCLLLRVQVYRVNKLDNKRHLHDRIF